jgi:hypothetical protein
MGRPAAVFSMAFALGTTIFASEAGAQPGFEFTHCRRAIWILPALVYFLLSQSPVSAIPISDLVAANGSIQQADKLFTNFRFESFLVAVGDISPQQTGAIDVQGVTASGGNGLRFSGPFSANFPGDGGSLAAATYHLGYDVFVTNPTFKVDAFSQSFTVTSGGVTSAHVSADVKNPAGFELFDVDTGFTGTPPFSPVTLTTLVEFSSGILTSFLSRLRYFHMHPLQRIQSTGPSVCSFPIL